MSKSSLKGNDSELSDKTGGQKNGVSPLYVPIAVCHSNFGDTLIEMIVIKRIDQNVVNLFYADYYAQYKILDDTVGTESQYDMSSPMHYYDSVTFSLCASLFLLVSLSLSISISLSPSLPPLCLFLSISLLPLSLLPPSLCLSQETCMLKYYLEKKPHQSRLIIYKTGDYGA